MSDKVMQDAEALLALEEKATQRGAWELHYGANSLAIMIGEDGGAFCMAKASEVDAALVVALRNTAPTVIRALMERVKGIDAPYESAYELARRIAHLEAERDIWRERAQGWAFSHAGSYPDLTPEEIAARVEQNRKEHQRLGWTANP